MMHKVALAALLAAPTALAFTPADLTGVWSCVVKDGFKNTKLQTATTEAVFTAFDSPDDSKILRVVVFDKPDNTKVTRRLSGRTYYTVATTTEEHDFHGLMTNQVEGSFYLDPNSENKECGAGNTREPATPIQVTVATNANFHPLLTPAASTTATGLPANYGGLCSSTAQGPWEFSVDDPDHLTLKVYENDVQLDNWPTGTTFTVANVASLISQPRIFVTEKCMRGLPQGSKMCALLARSSITSEQDMNNACTRDLVCAQSSSTQNWGCSGHKCCAIRGYTPPPVYPTYPSYGNYGSYPSYYNTQSYNYAPTYGNYGGYGGFWG
jgi:hypothetical protein